MIKTNELFIHVYSSDKPNPECGGDYTVLESVCWLDKDNLKEVMQFLKNEVKVKLEDKK